MSQDWDVETIDTAVTTPAGLGTIVKNALLALKTKFSGASLPTTNLYAGMEVTLSDGKRWRRNVTNDGWVRDGRGAYSTLASHATTADIWSEGETINWTGTATTTAFPDAPEAGMVRDLICAGACSFTFGANLTSPHFASGYTYTAQAGERVRVMATSTTTFIVETFARSGTYTPTLTNGTNVAASTAFACQWMQAGSVVTVSGQVSIDPTSSGVATVLSMSLPVAANIAANSNLGGTFNYGNANDGGAIYGAAVTDTADFVFVPLSTANRAFFFSFTYIVK